MKFKDLIEMIGANYGKKEEDPNNITTLTPNEKKNPKIAAAAKDLDKERLEAVEKEKIANDLKAQKLKQRLTKAEVKSGY